MHKGSSVVVAGRIYEVMEIAPTGDVLVQDMLTLQLKWVDFFLCRFIDPNENPGAVLEAMATIREGDDDARTTEPTSSSEQSSPL